jgi:hypothetical protein
MIFLFYNIFCLHLFLLCCLCTDIDECAEQHEQPLCPPDKTKCINHNGYFTCQCLNKGYVWHGEKCIDIDECKAKLDKCKNANCENTDGDYTCSCKDGYAFKKNDLTQRQCIGKV